jgi:signal peptidase I
MVFDFALLLVVLTFLTGLIWAVDAWFLKPKRPAAAPEPTVVEYARSFFPVILLVLLIRSFLFEPFRIPSDSMMPTLLDGDFIFVNKFSYGLRLPVVNTRVVDIGSPQRGDVVVFRKPSDPSTNYIKRLVGLPGDTIEVREKRVYVNGSLLPIEMDGIYEGHDHGGARIGIERIGAVEHRVLLWPDRESRGGIYVVPSGHYFFMGDNRDNSQDSRYPDVGYVPERNLVGKAVRIWFNWDGPKGPIWSRIGDAIH